MRSSSANTNIASAAMDVKGGAEAGDPVMMQTAQNETRSEPAMMPIAENPEPVMLPAVGEEAQNGQKKAASVGEAGVSTYQMAEHHGTILVTARANMDRVAAMAPVASLTGQEFQKTNGDSRNLRKKVIEFFNSFGNRVVRSDMGEIELNTSGVRDSLSHGYGKLKAATFAALSQVLESGEIISHNGPYEGHDYDSYIISAPVQVGDDTVYVGALVIKDRKQRYKLHEVLTESESGAPLFKSEATDTSVDGPLRNGTPLGAPEDALSYSTIAQTSASINSGVGKEQGSVSPAVRYIIFTNSRNRRSLSLWKP